RAMTQLLEIPAAEGEVFKVGRSEEISIRGLAERVASLVSPDVEITHVPHEEVYGEGFEDMQRRVPDLSKLESTIGFEAQFTMDEILHDVIDDVKGRSPTVSVSAERTNGQLSEH
ncbi:MAG: nucleoside-diphosphate sugar epimerase, partial [Salinibacter sp.]